VYRRYLNPEHRSYVPDFGVYIRVQGDKDIEYRTPLPSARAVLRRAPQGVAHAAEQRRAWRIREYKAQRSILADVDAARSRRDLFVRAEDLMKDGCRNRRRARTGTAAAAAPRFPLLRVPPRGASRAERRLFASARRL
jgi:pyruvate-ferredoxin/flavodoxin oxidoreductase